MLFTIMLAPLEEAERSLAEQIYIKYKRQIYKIAYSILNNYHDAEDVLNDVMLNVINNIEKIVDSDGNKTAALYIRRQIPFAGLNLKAEQRLLYIKQNSCLHTLISALRHRNRESGITDTRRKILILTKAKKQTVQVGRSIYGKKIIQHCILNLMRKYLSIT